MTDRTVKNDTFRTLATDTTFKGKVQDDMILRLLEAFAWKHEGWASGHACVQADASDDEMGGVTFGYVQGM